MDLTEVKNVKYIGHIITEDDTDKDIISACESYMPRVILH